jgi:glycosyltransferase involved in cell wall biosynthesis
MVPRLRFQLKRMNVKSVNMPADQSNYNCIMKILFMCGREIDYTRNQVLLRAFRRIAEVDTMVESGVVKSLFFRSTKIALRSFPKYVSSVYDMIFVGFYGHLLMIPVGLCSRTPIIFDAFVSTYDTLTADRLTFPPQSLRGRFAAYLDRFACHLADKILLDTPGQERYFSETFSISPDKLSSIPVSCNEDIFYPRDNPQSDDSVTTVLSYSSYLPIHGIDTIIDAAKILKNEPIQFRFIGNGPLFQSVFQSAKDSSLQKVIFLPPVSLNKLSDEIAASDICLGGHFGTSEKAKRVIPGKIYQMLAMQRPVIAADSPANKELLQHGSSAYLCPAYNPVALADAIRELYGNPHLCNRLAIEGRKVYEKYGSEAVVTAKLQKVIAEMNYT